MTGLRIAWFGSSLVSAYWNGAATYYRGLIEALVRRGHAVTFYEPDAFGRQAHRDLDDPGWARVVVYPGEGEAGVAAALAESVEADVVVKASGVGVFDALLEREIAARGAGGTFTVYWDVDAPATLERLRHDPCDPLRPLVARFDLVLTYGGGPAVIAGFEALGARRAVPIYNGLDPATHHPVVPDPRFACDLAFLGNRLPDRERRVDEFFFEVARRLPERRFLLGGAGWEDKPRPANVEYVGHVFTRDHNAWNSTPLAVLNVSRESMALCGWSPATRVFEAAGAAACLITDAWEGIAQFFEPGTEVLVANSGDEVAALLGTLDPERARAIGRAASARALAHHSYAERAAEVEALLVEQGAARREATA